MGIVLTDTGRECLLTVRIYHFSEPRAEGKCCSMSLKRSRASALVGFVRAMI